MSIKNYFFSIIIFIILSATVIYSDDIKKSIIGYSLDNRCIELYKFGNNKDIIIIIAGIHGNEANTTKTAFLLIELLAKGDITVPDNKAIWIIPNANPDGLIRDRRLNNNDVDLNRNFATDNWQPDFYFFNILLSAGKHPFSEPETIALKNFFESIDVNVNPVVLSLHSRGDLIIPGNNSKANNKLCLYIKQNSTYKSGDIGYNTTGDLTGWLSDKLGLTSVTIEFKTKTDIEIDEIKNIVVSLLKIDFTKSFYKYGISMETEEKKDIKNFDYLVHHLPKKIIAKINSSNEDKKNFIRLYELIQTREELLLLVNKTHLLSPDYKPDDLTEISDQFPSNKKTIMLRKIILPDLQDMFNAAKKENINLIIISAYRSYETQKNIYVHWQKIFGLKEAKRISAIAGASQHQLGTTIDFNSLQFSFGESKEGLWLAENAHKFGFIMSYPLGQEELTGYRYEPWHYRYIGKDAAYLVYNYFDNLLELFLNWYWEMKIDK